MKTINQQLYAIYKNGVHKGNEKGISEKDAILKYLKSAGYKDLLNDPEFINSYSSVKAVNGIHHHYVSKRTN